MATEIRSIPILKEREAEQFTARVKATAKLKASIDFRISVTTAKAILAKSSNRK